MVNTAEWENQAPEADAPLIELVRRGDAAAFERLFERHYATVFRAVYGLLGAREAAEDVAQETFMTMLREPPRLPPGATLAAWLCRVALNRASNQARGARREQARAQRLAEPDLAPGPEEAAVRAEERERVRRALAQLPERQARVLLLRHAGLAYAEVAQALEVAPGSVGTLLARAERAFAAAFDSGGAEPDEE